MVPKFRLPLLIALVIAVCACADNAFAQNKSGKLPELKTLQQKLQALEFFRNGLPSKRIGGRLRFTSSDLDKALDKNIETPEHKYAKPIGDAAFLKRAFLDIAGKIPAGHEVEAFEDNRDPRKRAKLVDYLLETREYSRKWAQYWTDVVFYNSNANKNRVNRKALEDWLAEAFDKDVPWDRITAALVSASPKYDKTKKKQKTIGANWKAITISFSPVKTSQVKSQLKRLEYSWALVFNVPSVTIIHSINGSENSSTNWRLSFLVADIR